MRLLILAAALGAVAIPATAANAQYGRGGYGYNQRGYGYDQREVRQERRECRRELRRAQTRREYQRELRECRREIARARRPVERPARLRLPQRSRPLLGRLSLAPRQLSQGEGAVRVPPLRFVRDKS